ncbi:hypothetical protein HZY97_08400 [Sphingomonas sp. R-74633]|uniref:hypothetical protein n=1 Tax=Sphingomonas sp. R-74633 TaxID=2751188 RepID=UPI0015D3D31B|nr:hypothetical protein [Sphingomonas sp. R-74633]NYT40773.1 hypothetical protein [Sphingomonas sp. R-74633]
MDAFEQLVAELFFAEGYWVQTSFKVELTKEEKAAVGRASSPRWEIDVVAYKAATDDLLAIECKSFLDSTGVKWAELQDGHASKRYKLFREPELHSVVLNRLRTQMVETGRCRDTTKVRLAMVAGKVKRGDEERLPEHIQSKGWLFFGPDWLRDRLQERARDGYSNQVSSIVAKLLIRGSAKEGPKATPGAKLAADASLTLIMNANPKKAGSMAHGRYELYSHPRARTVGGALSLGILPADLRNDAAKGYIRIG